MTCLKWQTSVSIEGMDMTGKMLDYTVHMYSSQGQTSVKRRQAKRQGKEYALHPPWLVLPDQASEPTLAYARAAGHRGDAESGRWGRRRGAPPANRAKRPVDLPIRTPAGAKRLTHHGPRVHH